MTFWCKFIGCWRLAKDGKRACRRHHCNIRSCVQPRHVGTNFCFLHNVTNYSVSNSSSILGLNNKGRLLEVEWEN